MYLCRYTKSHKKILIPKKKKNKKELTRAPTVVFGKAKNKNHNRKIWA